MPTTKKTAPSAGLTVPIRNLLTLWDNLQRSGERIRPRAARAVDLLVPGLPGGKGPPLLRRRAQQ